MRIRIVTEEGVSPSLRQIKGRPTEAARSFAALS